VLDPGNSTSIAVASRCAVARWPEDGQVPLAAAELAVQHQERQSAEVVAVQVGQHDGADAVRVDPLAAQRGEAGRAAVDEGVRRVAERDAGLEAPAGAERVTAADDGHPHRPILTRGRPPPQPRR
jgi:hypothetical protein